MSMLKYLGDTPTYGRLRSGVSVIDTDVFQNIKKPSGGVLFARSHEYGMKEKLNARGRITRQISLLKDAPVLSILSMPGLSWGFERQVLNRREGHWNDKMYPRRTRFTCVENDRMIYYGSVSSKKMPGRCSRNNVIKTFHPPPFAEASVGTQFIERFHLANIDDLMQETKRNKITSDRDWNNGWDVVWLDYTGPLSLERIKIIENFGALSVKRLLAITALKARWDGHTSRSICNAGGYLEWLCKQLPFKLVDYHEYNTSSPMAQIIMKTN